MNKKSRPALGGAVRQVARAVYYEGETIGASKVPALFVGLYIAAQQGRLQLIGIRADFALFRERLADACLARDKTETAIYQQIGLGGRQALTLCLTGPGRDRSVAAVPDRRLFDVRTLSVSRS